jgi:ribulose-phosphate 3-epimerase
MVGSFARQGAISILAPEKGSCMLAYVSLWSADLLALGEAVDELGELVDGFHIDVFDGHNARELLFGPDVVAALRQRTNAVLDVHLNVLEPNYWSSRFADAGATMITVQSGPCADVRETLEHIRATGAQPSLGLELHEPTSHAAQLFGMIDRVLLMGTQIGIRGVGMAPETPQRIQKLVAARRGTAGISPTGAQPSIVVDGGIRPHTIPLLAEAGADGIVPGSLVFNRPDAAEAVREVHRMGCTPVSSA